MTGRRYYASHLHHPRARVHPSSSSSTAIVRASATPQFWVFASCPRRRRRRPRVRSNTACRRVARRSTTYLWRPCGLDHSIIVIHRAKSASSIGVVVGVGARRGVHVVVVTTTTITTSRAKKNHPCVTRTTGSRVLCVLSSRDWWILEPDAMRVGPIERPINTTPEEHDWDARRGVWVRTLGYGKHIYTRTKVLYIYLRVWTSIHPWQMGVR